MEQIDRQVDTFDAALLYEDDAYREPLRGAVAAAGGSVTRELKLSEFDTPDDIVEPVLIVNLEPRLMRRGDLLDRILGYEGRLIFNDPEASGRLVGSARARWARHLAAKINQSERVYPPAPVKAPEPVSEASIAAELDPDDIELWILAASIGGPEALRSFLAELKPDLPFFLILVQHIGPEFIELMAGQLDQASRVNVRVAIDGEPLKPGRVYVVPPGKELRITQDRRLRMTDQRTDARYSPHIDQVMEDAVQRFGASTHAIIFSGMASDAINGAAAIMERGGEVWVQDPQTCVVSSMVDGSIKLGGVAHMADPTHLAHQLNQRGIEQI